MPERPGDRCLLQAAVDVTQRTGGLVHVDSCARGLIQLDAEHSSGGFNGPVDDTATGFERYHHAAAGRFEHSPEVIVK